MLNCKVRFAPSPTGYMHIGNARVAIINYLFCKKNNGKFLFRIDDTDSQRSKKEYEDAILNDIKWLGIEYDETFRQSARLDRYNEVLEILNKKGLVYKCFETEEELEFKRKRALLKGQPPVYDREALTLTQSQIEDMEISSIPSYWRFKLPNKVVRWDDIVIGNTSYALSNISDPVIAKSDGTFLYSFCSVIDDLDSCITHVLRGQDHVTNTAAQIAMIEAISGKQCNIKFGHFSLLVNKDGAQFSKRLGSLNLGNLRDGGLDPMAIWNLLATLGTSKDIETFIDLGELANYFDISSFGTNSPKFDTDLLFNLNKKIIRCTPYERLKTRLSLKMSEQQHSVIRDNIDNYNDLKKWDEILSPGYIPNIHNLNIGVVKSFKELLEKERNEFLSRDGATNLLKAVSEKTEIKGKDLYMPIQNAILGLENAPRLADTLTILSKNEILTRLSANILASA